MANMVAVLKENVKIYCRWNKRLGLMFAKARQLILEYRRVYDRYQCIGSSVDGEDGEDGEDGVDGVDGLDGLDGLDRH